MNEIMIAVQRDGKVVRVPVEAELFAVDGLELAVHRAPDMGDCWVVTEPRTGRSIGLVQASREDAMEQAAEVVAESGVQAYLDVIAATFTPLEPKGELVGTTLEALLQDWNECGYKHHEGRLLAVALAAQRAVAKAVKMAATPTGVPLAFIDEVCAKLGVKP